MGIELNILSRILGLFSAGYLVFTQGDNIFGVGAVIVFGITIFSFITEWQEEGNKPSKNK